MSPSSVKPDIDKLVVAGEKTNAKAQSATSKSELASGFGKDAQAASDRVDLYSKKNCNITSSDDTGSVFSS